MSGTDLPGNVHQGCPDEERRAAVYQMQITPQLFVQSMVSISFLWVKKTTRGGQACGVRAQKEVVKVRVIGEEESGELSGTEMSLHYRSPHGGHLSREPSILLSCPLESCNDWCYPHCGGAVAGGGRAGAWGKDDGEAHREPSHSFPTAG